MTRAATIQGSQTLTGINQDTQEARQSFGGFEMNRGLGDVLFAEEGRVMCEVLRRRDRRFYSTARLQHAPRQLLACKIAVVRSKTH